MSTRKTRLYRCSDEENFIIYGKCDRVVFPYREKLDEPKKGRSFCIKFSGVRLDSKTNKPIRCVLSFYNEYPRTPEKDVRPLSTICIPIGISSVKGFPQFALRVSSISRRKVVFTALRRRHL